MDALIYITMAILALVPGAGTAMVFDQELSFATNKVPTAARFTLAMMTVPTITIGLWGPLVMGLVVMQTTENGWAHLTAMVSAVVIGGGIMPLMVVGISAIVDRINRSW